MNYPLLTEELDNNKIKYKTNVILAPLTTWKVGGPADIFISVDTITQLHSIIKIIRNHKIPITMLGGGSNVLISDNGIRGVVIKFTGNNITINNIKSPDTTNIQSHIKPRLIEINTNDYTNFEILDYDERKLNLSSVEVVIESGAILPMLINTLLNQDITGLQWFAGIPGTLGGAIYNNIHGGSHYISQYIKDVTIINNNNEIKTIAKSELNFDYDYSQFHKTHDVILSATLILYKGNVTKAHSTLLHWIKQKKRQPKNSAGCVFKNITEEERIKNNLKSSSWGYIIDKVFKLKNYTVGNAKISSNHAAFIETQKQASSQDILQIINKIIKTSEKTLHITPKLEIILLGYPEQIISKYTS